MLAITGKDDPGEAAGAGHRTNPQCHHWSSQHLRRPYRSMQKIQRGTHTPQVLKHYTPSRRAKHQSKKKIVIGKIICTTEGEFRRKRTGGRSGASMI